ncbi:MAG: 30S ribosomal protein S16 [Erysipelotrichaceae bacterium]
MAVKLRLKRMGSKKAPFYRIVAADSRFPRDGRFIETIGNFDSIKTPAILNVNEELALKWLHNGAQPSDTVRNLLASVGIMKKFHEEKLANKKNKKEAK